MATPRRLRAIAERRVSGLVAMRRAAAWTCAARTGSSAGSFAPVAGGAASKEYRKRQGHREHSGESRLHHSVPSDPVDEVMSELGEFFLISSARAPSSLGELYG